MLFRSVSQSRYLTWKYLNPTLPMPYGIQKLSEYDVWDHSTNWTNVLTYQYGARVYLQNPSNDETFYRWKDVIRNTNDSYIIELGRAILDYDIVQKKILAQDHIFECVFEGYNCLCIVHSGPSLNDLYELYPNYKNYDILIQIKYFNNRIWSVSLRSINSDNVVDVSAIAAKYVYRRQSIVTGKQIGRAHV